MIYCIDTSALIGAWWRSVPPDVFPPFWEKLEELVRNKQLIATIEVLKELEKKDDSILHWAKSINGLFQPINIDLQKKVSEILRKFPRLVESKKNRSMADPFVIGLAQLHTDPIIITEEKPSGNLEKPKIPEVCRYFNIQYINLIEFMRNEGWVFTRIDITE